MTLIVTGFVDLQRFEDDSQPRTRPASEYHDRVAWLVLSLAPVLCFDDARLLGNAGTWRYEPTLFEPVDADEVAAALRSGKQAISWDPRKDTPAYFCLMRHKIDWLARATLLGSSHYAWLDYGYRHRPGDDAYDLLRRAPEPGKIRIAELSYVPRAARASREAFYQQHWWPVGGGLLVAAASEIHWLQQRIAEEWAWALDNGYAVTDEMMIGWIRYQCPERFEIYYADHPSLLSNYLTTRASPELIRYMAQKARDDGDYAECEARLLSIGKPWP